MRKLVLALCIALSAILVWLLARGEHAPAARASASPPAVVTATEPAHVESATSLEPSARASTEIRVPVASPPAPEDSVAVASDRARVFGRVVDDARQPVEGARVSLASVDGEWCADAQVPEIELDGYVLRAFVQTTDADGRFRFDVPTPTAEWVSLNVEPPPFFALTGREFGPAGGRNQPRLVAGDDDLGELVVQACGGVRGRVRSADGKPITAGRVSLDGKFPNGRGVSCRIGPDGAYELGHVPTGTSALRVDAEGWLSATVSGVEVKARTFASDVDFVLESAPSISGVVVDDHGVAVEGVRVWGWPTSSGRGAGAKSGAEGRFTIHLPQNEPYSLEVRNASGFADWGGLLDAAAVFAPGRDDVRIVLRRAPAITLHVVDAETSAPIERFSVVVLRLPSENESWSRILLEQPIDQHAGGAVTLPARAGLDEVGVAAAGHAPFEAPVSPDAPGSGVQTLRLVRGSTLVGRAVMHGAPATHVAVEIGRDSTTLRSSDESSVEPAQFDVGEFAGRPREAAGAVDGSFRVEDLAAGTYTLTIHASGSAPLVRRGVHVAAGSTLDLGSLELAPGATVHGRVILPAHVSPVGLALRIDGEWGHDTPIRSADGSFTLEGLTAGEHTISLDPGESAVEVLTSIEQRTVTLAEGGSGEVVFDLSDRGACTLELTVLRNGKPEAGVRVDRETRGPDGSTTNSRSFGVTNEAGLVRGSCPGGTTLTLVAKHGALNVLGRTRELTLVAGDERHERLDLSLGSLRVVLPSGLAVPDKGIVSVTLQSKRESERRGWVELQSATPNAPPGFGSDATWTSSTVEFVDAPVGEFNGVVRVDAYRLAEAGDGRNWSQKELRPAETLAVEIRPGETTTITLR